MSLQVRTSGERGCSNTGHTWRRLLAASKAAESTTRARWGRKPSVERLGTTFRQSVTIQCKSCSALPAFHTPALKILCTAHISSWSFLFTQEASSPEELLLAWERHRSDLPCCGCEGMRSLCRAMPLAKGNGKNSLKLRFSLDISTPSPMLCCKKKANLASKPVFSSLCIHTHGIYFPCWLLKREKGTRVDNRSPENTATAALVFEPSCSLGGYLYQQWVAAGTEQSPQRSTYQGITTATRPLWLQTSSTLNVPTAQLHANAPASASGVWQALGLHPGVFCIAPPLLANLQSFCLHKPKGKKTKWNWADEFLSSLALSYLIFYEGQKDLSQTKLNHGSSETNKTTVIEVKSILNLQSMS